MKFRSRANEETLQINRPDSLYSDDEYDKQIMDPNYHIIGKPPNLRRLSSRLQESRRCSTPVQILLAITVTFFIISLGVIVIFLGIKQSWDFITLKNNTLSKEALSKINEYLNALELPELNQDTSIPRIFHLSDEADNNITQFSENQWHRHLMGGISKINIVGLKQREVLLNTTYPWLKEYFRLVTIEKKIAVARYLFLFTFGGWFIDSRNVCLRPIDHGWSSHQMIFVSKHESPGVISPSFIASVPRHPIWIQVVRQLIMDPSAQEESILRKQVEQLKEEFPTVRIKIFHGETYEHVIKLSSCRNDLFVCRDIAYKNSANVHIMRIIS